MTQNSNHSFWSIHFFLMVKQKGQVQIGLEWHSTCECSKILEMYSTWVSVPNPKLSANSEFEPEFFFITRVWMIWPKCISYSLWHQHFHYLSHYCFISIIGCVTQLVSTMIELRISSSVTKIYSQIYNLFSLIRIFAKFDIRFFLFFEVSSEKSSNSCSHKTYLIYHHK